MSGRVDDAEDEDRMQTQITIISPTTPPDRTEELNGMEEKDGEENELWKNEEEEQKRQNDERTNNEEQRNEE